MTGPGTGPSSLPAQDHIGEHRRRAAAKEVAYADPAPLVPTQLGGDWSTWWYNGRIYESDITRGMMIWRLDDLSVMQYLRMQHLNPQTQEFSID